MEKNAKKLKRKKRIRSRVSGSSARPRLAVFRSNVNIYGQLIDDYKATTIFSVSTTNLSEDKNKMTKTEKAKYLGIEIAKKALKKGIKKVVFDRGGYRYHGRVRALAEGAREGGLEF